VQGASGRRIIHFDYEHGALIVWKRAAESFNDRERVLTLSAIRLETRDKNDRVRWELEAFARWEDIG
jgi:hypothetical protein